MRDELLDDFEAEDVHATASGIIECLRMLADEAASLQLSRTTDALRRVILLCRAEHLSPELGLAESAASDWATSPDKLH
jgi:hypothetical protein